MVSSERTAPSRTRTLRRNLRDRDCALPVAGHRRSLRTCSGRSAVPGRRTRVRYRPARDLQSRDGSGCATLLAYTLLTRRSGLSRAVAALAAIVLVAVFSSHPLGGNRVEALSTTTSLTQAAQGNTTNSLDWRFGHWTELIGLWRDKPIFGYGSGATTSLSSSRTYPAQRCNQIAR